MDSLHQAAEATTFALTKGIERSTVEILLPEFWDPMSGAVFSQEGDQMRFWRLARRFADDLISMTNSSTVTIVRSLSLSAVVPVLGSVVARVSSAPISPAKPIHAQIYNQAVVWLWRIQALVLPHCAGYGHQVSF